MTITKKAAAGYKPYSHSPSDDDEKQAPAAVTGKKPEPKAAKEKKPRGETANSIIAAALPEK